MSKIYSIGASWNRNQAGVEHAINIRHELFDKIGYENKIILLDSFSAKPKSDKFITLANMLTEKPSSVINEARRDDESQIVCQDNYEIYISDLVDVYVDSSNSNVLFIYDKAENKFIINDINVKTIRLTYVEFVAYCLNKYLEDDDIIIFDRTDYLEELPSKLPRFKRILPIHNNHKASNDIFSTKSTNGFYTYFLNNLQDFDYVVTSTEEQMRDISKEFKFHDVKCIPVAYCDDELIEKARHSERIENSAVMFTRIALDKRIDSVIRSWKKVVDKFDDAFLAIYGFANSAEALEACNNAIKENDLEENVAILDYIKDKNKVFSIEQHSDLYLLASTAEGFNIGLMEGLENGAIGVAHDVKYGPSELLIDELLVEYNNPDAFSDKIIEILSNREYAEELRQKSLDHMAKHYSEQTIAEKWMNLIKECDKDASFKIK